MKSLKEIKEVWMKLKRNKWSLNKRNKSLKEKKNLKEILISLKEVKT